MPRLQIYDRQEVQTPNPANTSFGFLRPQSIADSGALSMAARATAGMAEVEQKARESEADAWASNTLATARLAWTQQLENRKQQAQPGAPEFTTTLDKDFQEYANGELEKAPTQIARTYLTRRMNQFRYELAEKAMHFEAQAKYDYKVDQYKSSIDSSRKLMNTDPTQFDTTLAERLAEIDAAGLDPVRKSALRDKAIKDISSAAVYAQIQKSPGQFLESIGFYPAGDGRTRPSSGDLTGSTGNKAFDVMPFEDRVKYFEHAVQRKAQIDMDVDRTSAAQKKAVQDDAMKNLIGWNADGKLRRDLIENYRPVLSYEQYQSALKMLDRSDRPEVTKSDPTTFRELQQLIVDGKWNEAERYAITSHTNGRLSNEHLSSSLERIRSHSRQEGPKSPFEQMRSYITNSLAPSPMIPDPIGKARYAEAMDTFETWVRGKPNATPEEIDKYGKELTSRYRFVNLSDKLGLLPQPRTGAVSKDAANPKLLEQQLRVNGNLARQKYERGEWNKSEFDQEMALLGRYQSELLKGGK